MISAATAASRKMENLDKNPNEYQRIDNAYKDNNIFVKKIFESRKDKIEIENVRSSIVETYKPAFTVLWNNIYVRMAAISGDTKIYPFVYAAFDCITAESALSEVAKVASFASTSMKQPYLECIPKDMQSGSKVSKSIEISNKIIDKTFYENVSVFNSCFSTSLKAGIAFMHVDARNMYAENLEIKQISSYRCMWDLTKRAQDIHKGSFFLYEEFMSSNAIRDMFSNDDVEQALKTKPDTIDTFPTNEMQNLILNNEKIVKGTEFSIEKTYNFKFQTKGEIAVGHHKITTIYVRNKKPKVDDRGNKTFKNAVEKLVYINNILVEVSEAHLEFIPIVAFAPMEEMNHNVIKDRFMSIYDLIRSELLNLAILTSSLGSVLINSTGASTFIREDCIPLAARNSKSINRRIVPIKPPADGTPVSQIVSSIPSTGIPVGITETIAMLKTNISQKLNILTSHENAAKSAQQEQIRIDNQVVLSSSIIETLDKSVLQFGIVMKDFIKSIVISSPEKIQDILDITDIEINAETASEMAYFLSISRVVLEESEYFTTNGERDLKKLERISQLTGESFSLPAHVIMEIAGVSKETIELVKEAEIKKIELEHKSMQLDNKNKELAIEKQQAEIEKIKADAAKLAAEANKKLQEAIEIDKNMKDEKEDPKAKNEKQTVNKKVNK